eukprot:TRINITY_DN19009_c0_g1_i1.p1 TRINITY_DN19009_c0_g1~~TRINITY_DN19009_c0_g1_i1.p1  ORF type:complete len:120 (-),score=28.03 TRINITY_DN19009_c0_g1_i1:246-605(-)
MAMVQSGLDLSRTTVKYWKRAGDVSLTTLAPAMLQLVPMLAGVHSIHLERCWEVPKESIEALAGAHTVNLRMCNQVTEGTLKSIRGVSNVTLSDCTQLSDAAVTHLAASTRLTSRGARS